MKDRHQPSDPETASPEDARLLEMIATHYRPRPMDAGRRAAFRRRLAERLAQRTHPVWRPAMALAAAAVAVVLWLAVPRGERMDANESVAGSEANASVLYAFVDPDRSDAQRPQPSDFVPDDYAVLASALEIPIDDL